MFFEVLNVMMLKLKVLNHAGERIMEIYRVESQCLPGEITMCHQEVVVMLQKIGKGNQFLILKLTVWYYVRATSI